MWTSQCGELRDEPCDILTCGLAPSAVFVKCVLSVVSTVKDDERSRGGTFCLARTVSMEGTNLNMPTPSSSGAAFPLSQKRGEEWREKGKTLVPAVFLREIEFLEVWRETFERKILMATVSLLVNTASG